MKTTLEYLDDAKKILDISSDYEMSKRIGITRSAISNYRKGTSKMDDYTAVKLAEVLKLNPMEVIAAANMEREKDIIRKEFWRELQCSKSADNNTDCILCQVAERRIRHGPRWHFHRFFMERRSSWIVSTTSDTAPDMVTQQGARNS